MKALLLLTALMVSALPAKADDTQFTNRKNAIGLIIGADCLVRNGWMTEERTREMTQEIVNKSPELNAAYSWATTSNKATQAVQTMAPYMNSECDNLTISEEEAQRLLKPYLD